MSRSGRDNTADTRERLLEATLDYVSEHRVAEVGIRELARALGTTHRMLGYHFGSKEGLLVEVVRAVEQRQRDALAELTADATAGPVEQMRRMAERVADPSVWPNERLFFALYGQALQGDPIAGAMLPEVITAWLEPLAELSIRLGIAPEDSEAHARLLVAISRGLLLDLLTTGDLDMYRRALELFLRQFVPHDVADSEP